MTLYTRSEKCSIWYCKTFRNSLWEYA